MLKPVQRIPQYKLLLQGQIFGSYVCFACYSLRLPLKSFGMLTEYQKYIDETDVEYENTRSEL